MGKSEGEGMGKERAVKETKEREEMVMKSEREGGGG